MKQRLVGAVVLVALAVIFLPMLLDGAGTDEDVAREVRIPERPEVPEADLDAAPEPVAPADEPVAEAPDAVPEESEPPGEAGDDEQAVADVDAAGEPDDADATTTETDAPSAWAVQTGSFTRQENATAQRDRLRDAGFDAFLEEGESDGTRIWRVRVGPIGREEDARAMRDRLEADADLAGIVVSHP